MSCAWLQSFSLEDVSGFESFIHRLPFCWLWVDDEHDIGSTFAQELKLGPCRDGSWSSVGIFLENSFSICLCEELSGIHQKL